MAFEVCRNSFKKGVKSLLLLRIFQKEGRKEMFYLMTHSTHFMYGYMASDIW